MTESLNVIDPRPELSWSAARKSKGLVIYRLAHGILSLTNAGNAPEDQITPADAIGTALEQMGLSSHEIDFDAVVAKLQATGPGIN